MINSKLFALQNSAPNDNSFRNEFESSIFKEFGPQSNSKCFTDEKRADYIEKLLAADTNRELPKQIRGFCLGDAHNAWDPAEWRYRAKTAEKIYLWTKKTFSSSAKNLGILRRIVVLEEFFDLIKSLHERPNKDGYNGQKKLFNMIKNRYACLPRDAVDKYITMWRKATSQASPADSNCSCIYEHEKDGNGNPNNKTVTSTVATIARTATAAGMLPASAAVATSALESATTLITIPAAGINEDNRLKRNSTTTSSQFSIDSMNRFSGISMVYQPPQLTTAATTNNDQKLSFSITENNSKHQIEQDDSNVANNNGTDGNIFECCNPKSDCDSSNHDSSKENNFDSDDVIPNKRIKLEDGDSETNTENEEVQDENNSLTNTEHNFKVNGVRKPSDVDMAYNIFVRRLVDGTLDRTVTFCEQPKSLISNLESICAEAFPTFDRSRHRIKIRGYLKACRRNSKKHNGKVSMKDTPSHMCSEKAYSIANEAMQKVEKEIDKFKLVKLDEPDNNNQFCSSDSMHIDRPRCDTKFLDYVDSAINSSSLEPATFPVRANSGWTESEHFSSIVSSFLPSVYGMFPLPPLLTFNVTGMTGDGICPPPAHSNQYFNTLPSCLFSVTDGRGQYSATGHLMEKMLHCDSIDPDFGMQLLINRSASQEAINCMRITARYLLSRSLMIESYLLKETTKLQISSDEKN